MGALFYKVGSRRWPQLPGSRLGTAPPGTAGIVSARPPRGLTLGVSDGEITALDWPDDPDPKGVQRGPWSIQEGWFLG